MKFSHLSLEGAYAIDLEPKEDERGFFARSFCEEEFSKWGLKGKYPQCNVSFNRKKGTLRGIHYSVPPFSEAKLVRCTQGMVYDLLLDLRSDSPTFLRWTSLEISSKNRKMVYVPEGVAHGFLTLEDDSELFYQMSAPFHSSYARGVRWNDPQFTIKWPMDPTVISENDRNFPNYSYR